RPNSILRPAVFFQALDQFNGFFLAITDAAGPHQPLVTGNGIFDAAAGADHGAVIALAHAGADLGEAQLGGLADQIHRDAAGEADGALTPAGHQIFMLEAEIFADATKDALRLDRLGDLLVQVAQ